MRVATFKKKIKKIKNYEIWNKTKLYFNINDNGTSFHEDYTSFFIVQLYLAKNRSQRKLKFKEQKIVDPN